MERAPDQKSTLNGIQLNLKSVRTCATLASGVDLSRFRAAPSARLSHFPFESDGAFPTQC